jgi:hypothetical protein
METINHINIKAIATGNAINFDKEANAKLPEDQVNFVQKHSFGKIIIDEDQTKSK